MSMTESDLRLKGFVEVAGGRFERVKAARGPYPSVDGAQSASNRQSEGKAGHSSKERDLHDAIEAHCKQMGWLYRHDRMDKPTTGQIGWPDFVIFRHGGQAVFIECKAKGKKATTEQLATLAWARKMGFIAEVCDSFEGYIETVS